MVGVPRSQGCRNCRRCVNYIQLPDLALLDMIGRRKGAISRGLRADDALPSATSVATMRSGGPLLVIERKAQSRRERPTTASLNS